jgi:hypothetical protein
LLAVKHERIADSCGAFSFMNLRFFLSDIMIKLIGEGILVEADEYFTNWK